LDAPELVDDYYLNLLSWSADNILAVALGRSVYLWDAGTEEIEHLVTLEGDDSDFVTSVSWCHADQTNILAVGTNGAQVQIWDCTSLTQIRTLTGHTARVGSLAWGGGGASSASSASCLTSGSRDSLIFQHDVRAPRHRTTTYVGHTQEVCGLKWNQEGTTLASGGNENYLCIWDAAMSGGAGGGAGNDNNGHANNNTTRPNAGSTSSECRPRHLLTHHQAAVKALAWSPFHRGLLASGGGTADRTIKFWNSTSGSLLNSVDTGSQVCSLLWNQHHRHELVSSHGYSDNELVLWDYPTMTKVQEFKGHQARVLHMDQSPDGGTIVSAAADETLRFWNIFKPAPHHHTSSSRSGIKGKHSSSSKHPSKVELLGGAGTTTVR
jgi:cell division cycle protein 20 (cofactor of APC complex)